MMAQQQIALIAEQVVARRGDAAFPFAVRQTELATACGDKGAEMIWRDIAATLQPHPWIPERPAAE